MALLDIDLAYGMRMSNDKLQELEKRIFSE